MKQLNEPCGNCPFRTDSPFATAGLPRAPEIAANLRSDRGDFQCHKTTRETGNGKPRGCAGAYKVLLNEGRMNQLMRISERLGLWDPAATMAGPAPVYESLDAWVRAMLRPLKRRAHKPRRRMR